MCPCRMDQKKSTRLSSIRMAAAVTKGPWPGTDFTRAGRSLGCAVRSTIWALTHRFSSTAPAARARERATMPAASTVGIFSQLLENRLLSS